MPARKPPPSQDTPETEPEIPDIPERTRTPKFKKLQTAIEGIYVMIGGAMLTLPPQIGGRFRPYGLAFAGHSEQIASAWIDLAEENKQVLRVLESMTSFSGWGQVIGEHLKAVAEASPGMQPRPTNNQQAQQQPFATDIGSVMQAMAGITNRQSAARTKENPPDMGPTPQQVQEMAARQAQAEAEAQQPIRGQVRQQPAQQGNRRAGMPSAADLGVEIPDLPVDFPTSDADSVKG